MKNSYGRKIIFLVAIIFVVAMVSLLVLSAIASDEVTAVCVLNDIPSNYKNETIELDKDDSIKFSSHSWGVSNKASYSNRFVGSDEHWIDSSKISNVNDQPWVEVTFFGCGIELWGHTCPNGGMMSVTLDNNLLEEKADFYSSVRKEAKNGSNPALTSPVYSIKGLENALHTVRFTRITEKNPSAGSSGEIGIDYFGIIKSIVKDPIKDIKLPENAENAIMLFVGETYKIEFETVPALGDVSTLDLEVSSSDESVATVDKNGSVKAIKSGNAVISLNQKGSDQKIKINVEVSGASLAGCFADKGLFSSPDDLLSVRKTVKTSSPDEKASVTVYKNDISNVKLHVFAKETSELKVEVSDFINEKGEILDKSCIRATFMDPIQNHKTGKPVYDIISNKNTKTLKKGTLGAVWVEISTDGKTNKGVYSGKITVSDKESSIEFGMTVEVIALDISKADESLTMELWMYPYSSNRYYSGKSVKEYFGTDSNTASKVSLRSVYLDDKYDEPLIEQIKLYAKAGGDVITATLIEDAWQNQTHDPYPSMVKWTKKSNGSFVFDYTDFDKWVQMNLDNGVDGQIKCFSPGSWNIMFVYYDEATGKNKQEKADIGSDRWFELWKSCLTDLMKHSKEKGWFEMISISSDERPAETLDAIIKLVDSVKDENGNTFKLSMAANRLNAKSYFDSFSEIMFSSSQISNGVDSVIAERNKKGLRTGLYTCGATAGSLAQEPYEILDFFYRMYKMGGSGYLRWALDAFNEDPLVNSNHWQFEPGDINLIYPDRLDETNPTVQTSARFQIMAEAYKNIAAIETVRMYKGRDALKAPILKYTSWGGNVKVAKDNLSSIDEALMKAALTIEEEPVDDPDNTSAVTGENVPETEQNTPEETRPVEDSAKADPADSEKSEKGCSCKSNVISGSVIMTVLIFSLAAELSKKKKA